MFPARALGHFNERSLRCDCCRALRVFASFGKTFVFFVFRIASKQPNVCGEQPNRINRIGLLCEWSG